MALVCVVAGAVVLGRAGYHLYMELLRIDASTLARAPVVLLGHLGRFDRIEGEFESLRLRTRRALYSIDESTRVFVRTGRLIGRTASATKTLLGVVPTPWKKLGS